MKFAPLIPALLMLVSTGPLCAQSGDAPNAQINLAETEQSLFHLPPGFEIQLVTSEPAITKPLNLNFDAFGRLWVSTTATYPWPAKRDAAGEPIDSFTANWEANQLAFRAAAMAPEPAERGSDAIYVLSEFASTGRAGKVVKFADGLNIPMGIVPLPRAAGKKGDTVIAFSIPAIWSFEDTDGDGTADKRIRLYGDFGFKDTHGMSSNYVYWLDGWIYGAHGFANRSEIKDGAGIQTVLDSGNTFRFRADGSQFEPWTWGQTNPHGLAFDPRGDLYSADSHSKPVYLLLHGGYYEGIGKKHDGLGFAPAITDDYHGSSAIAGIAYYAAEQFPLEFHGNLFNGNPVTRRVNRDRLEWHGSTPTVVRMPDLLTSDDRSFRPVQVKLGPDGALWISDFYNPIIGHYEVPLTHPSRDRGHGRIWRIVWRGLDKEVPVPPMPNLGTADARSLAQNLSDRNLAVRLLAANEIVDRVGVAATPRLLEIAAATFPRPGNPASLPLAQVLERLGASDDRLLVGALLESSDETGVATIRILAERPNLGIYGEDFFQALVARTQAGFVWRALADLFMRHPETWQTAIILDMLHKAPASDKELIYALRLSLKKPVTDASLEQLERWSALNPEAASYIAGVCPAIKTAGASEFLLSYLERTHFADPAAGELARHAVQYLPPARYGAIEHVIQSLDSGPLPQQLALAEGVAAAAKDPTSKLPPSVEDWMRRTLVAISENSDALLARRAIEAAQPLDFAGKLPALRRLALDPKIPQSSLRLAALKALPTGPAHEDIFTIVLNDPSASAPLRKAAVALLAKPEAGPSGRTALVKALSSAPSDLALEIVIVLVKSEEGTDSVLNAVESGKLPARMLNHAYVKPELAKRSEPLLSRATQLTRKLPSENARIDSVISDRLALFAKASPNAARGAAVFLQNCAACHQRGNVGTNLGPNLDELSARGVERVMEDVLDPSRNIDPVFRLHTVIKKNGESETGINLRSDGDHYSLSEIGGKEINVPKDQVMSVTPLEVSPMPGIFESALRESDFCDLVGYLLRPSGTSLGQPGTGPKTN